MTPEVLAALVLFNTLVAEYRERFTPDSRVFVGTQSGEDDGSGGYAWTKCVPESGVFVVQISARGLTQSWAGEGRATFPGMGQRDRLEFLAAHEAYHVALHAPILCGGRYAALPVERKREMEIEADRCAIESIAAMHEVAP